MPHYECESPRKNAIMPTLQDATACCIGAKCPRNLAPQPGAPGKRPPPKTCSARKFQAIVPENVGGVFSLCFVHLLRSSAFNQKKWKEHVRSDDLKKHTKNNEKSTFFTFSEQEKCTKVPCPKFVWPILPRKHMFF